MSAAITHCCDLMTGAVNFYCPDHKTRFDCPDALIYYSTLDGSYGLIVHDGGSASIQIQYCPWCGKALKQPNSEATKTNKKIYECWWDENRHEVTLTTHVLAKAGRSNEQIGRDAVLRYRFSAGTYEEACAIHALRQGWGSYNPMGEAANCPECSEKFYPLGSGECWKCGHKQ
jgi:hypothetical protein